MRSGNGGHRVVVVVGGGDYAAAAAACSAAASVLVVGTLCHFALPSLEKIRCIATNQLLVRPPSPRPRPITAIVIRIPTAFCEY